ncbi:c-type cytochrome [Sediminibacterium sp.]|uniref:c-type cytochrome n=1 Tax=Sediminibacterium sp. TaxID=1917865 RepID=UPI002734E6BA|nr:c-type cytochrome [Sediminibacterium sp.]MDP3394469.1 c-type cytochrome [Sediminibacterium sp.]MDP3568304.1 c-type cytochrome [Sediminibacterium sp.]
MRNSLFLFFALLFFSACYYDKSELVYPAASAVACDTANVKFSTSLMPILNTSCNSCHGGTAAAGAGIVLDNYAGVRASVLDGKFMNSIIQNGQASAMPKGGGKLSACDISKFQVWINAGMLNN